MLRIDEAGKNVNVHVLLADDSEGKREGEGEIANALRIIQWRNRAMVITQARREKNKILYTLFKILKRWLKVKWLYV